MRCRVIPPLLRLAILKQMMLGALMKMTKQHGGLQVAMINALVDLIKNLNIAMEEYRKTQSFNVRQLIILKVVH